ncbi:ATP-binding cassette domain-containing protein [Bartonella sp. HY329]|uniref:ABC transporter ATP-binding protein n=1 Tax=unclassified Bartonella TaxID=2645622 RepID=UPI0021C7B7F3|nr:MULTISPECIES: ATP-binding cassette domain-containing protein [unclassified Bartonella]UXM95667.1 ATP-binding cassette domain-containing protein [Bartonella sp. HY329]UXN09992.1 ATP-binding cassette domain-containing protein [Bartonella sp. HY328]
MNAFKKYIDISLVKPLMGAEGAFDLNVDIAIFERQFVALCGPSGAGKTSLLRLIAGLDKPQIGQIDAQDDIWFSSQRQINKRVQNRHIGFVFQDYALFPNMSVQKNLYYAIKEKHKKKIALDYLALVGLENLANMYPAQLSGGQQQRLALIRALASKPKLLLLDEPLSALDPQMRLFLQGEIRRLHDLFETTTIMISHDKQDIIAMADRIVELNAGKIVTDKNLKDYRQNKLHNKLEMIGEILSLADEDGFVIVKILGQTIKQKIDNLPQGFKKGDVVQLCCDQLKFNAAE